MKKNNEKIVFAGIATENIGTGDMVKIEIDKKKGSTIISLVRSDTDFFNLTSNKMKK